jgi:L-ascorbate metabolism protein UlaG (beta-lactamase superfamily)
LCYEVCNIKWPPSFLFAGADALYQDIKQIDAYYDINLAISPMGDLFTIGIEEALHAVNYVEAKKNIGIHCDGFSGIEIDHETVRCMAEERSKTLILMGVRQTTEF